MQLHTIPRVKLILQIARRGDDHGYIYVRVGIPGEKRYVPKSLGHKVPVTCWDATNEIVTRTHPDAARINELCRVYLVNLRENLDKEYKAGTFFTRETIEGILSPQSRSANFVAFFQRHISVLSQEFTPAYIRSFTTSYNTFTAFAGPAVPFHRITSDYLATYRASIRHFKTGMPLSRNTIYLRMRHLKEVIDSAIDQGHIDRQSVRSYKWPAYKAPEKQYLVLEQTEKLWNLIQIGYFKSNDALQKTACYFLVECYSGLRVSDWPRFTTETIIDNKALKVHARKNGEPVYLYFDTFQRLGLIVQYIQQHHIVFDIAEQVANRLLKRIGDKIGASFEVTTHTGRHTFGTLLAVLGYNKAEIADHMAISEDTAAIYAKNTGQSSRAAQLRNGGL